MLRYLQGLLLLMGGPCLVVWHPIVACREFEPGRWIMFGTMKRPYAIVVLLEIGGVRGCRAVTWAVQTRDRELVGYYRTLMAARR
jgi:hypothetical protein